MRVLRRPIFLACEGQSEQGYGRWINRLVHDLSIPIAVQADDVGGGDPLDLISKAITRLERIERQRGLYPFRGLLLDSDRRGHDQARDREAFRLAQETRIEFVWQEPCHEAFLIRHFDGYQNFNPPDEREIWNTLGRIWPEYTKGMDADGYGAKLTLDHLVVARSNEASLDGFLQAAGWK